MITFGIVAFSCCVAYMVYMRTEAEADVLEGRTYTAMNDQDQLVTRRKRSKWE